MSTITCDIYNSIGELLDYPSGDLLAGAASCRRQLAEQSPAAAREIEAFLKIVAAMDQGAREELYTAAFDLSPACTPYVSVHLFGAENYKRGELMARLNGAFAEYGFAGGSELPDHLAVLLRFLPCLPREEREELIVHCLLEPVRTMTELLRKAENPYHHALRAIQHVLAGAQAACPDLSVSRLRVEEEQFADGTPIDRGKLPALRQEECNA